MELTDCGHVGNWRELPGGRDVECPAGCGQPVRMIPTICGDCGNPGLTLEQTSAELHMPCLVNMEALEHDAST